MTPPQIATTVLVVSFLLVETRRSRINERFQRAQGGIEPRGDVYAAMAVVYPGCFVAMIAEGTFGRSATAGDDLFSFGLAIFALAKALKWWAIMALGRCWTFRVVVVPGTQPVTSGPYRYLRHPNYVAIVGELVGVACMMGAPVTGPLSVVLFGLLMWRRITIESRALDAILRP